LEIGLSNWEVGSAALERVHREANNSKFSGFFTGFLEGILASKKVEDGELEPLVITCMNVLKRLVDGDAYDILEDFKAEVLEFEQLVDIVDFRKRHLNPDCEKTELNRFMGYCSGIACDGHITLEEAKGVLEFTTAYPKILVDPIAKTIALTCLDALDDGVIDANESELICEAISNLVGDSYSDTGISSLEVTPIFQEAIISEMSELAGATVVLTGNFETKPRRLLEKRLLDFEITSKSSPCKKTHFVIVANESSRDWKYTHKGNKIVRALQLREENGAPQFISESAVMRLLELT
jgi:hypothetical protein